jgi:hypothetical protein
MRRLARRREEVHKDSPTSRPISPDYEFLGVVGEWVFEEITGFPMDRSVKREGDGRVDFMTPLGPLDVKTARKAYNLLRECDKEHADVLVLAQFHEGPPVGATLLGWEWGRVMLECPTRVFRGDWGILNHFKAAQQLRSMHTLYFRLGVSMRVLRCA